MIDQDPLPWWTQGRVTLLGDAAHPDVSAWLERGGPGYSRRTRARRLPLPQRESVEALEEYESQRLPATADVVRMNRTNPPDAILREVYLRTGDKPFAQIDEVIRQDELVAFVEAYRRVSGGTVMDEQRWRLSLLDHPARA